MNSIYIDGLGLLENGPPLPDKEAGFFFVRLGSGAATQGRRKISEAVSPVTNTTAHGTI